MIKEAIDRVTELAKQAAAFDLTQNVIGECDGKQEEYTYKVTPTQFGRSLGDVIKPFRPATLDVTTLTGFLDAIKAGVGKGEEGKLASRVVHVENHLTVSLKSALTDRYGVRETYLTAKYEPKMVFQFDQFYADPQQFIIKLQSSFLITDALLKLLRIASGLRSGKSVHVNDDGFSQSVVLKTGEVTTAEVAVEPRMKLVPRRSFDEPAAVESEFLVRFRQTAEETPAIALYDLEGTKWQGDVMRAIKKYLADNLPEVPVLA